MANIFQKLGLLKSDEEDPSQQQAPIVKPIVQPTTMVTMGGSETARVAKSNTDYDKYLEDVLDKGNQPGIDFLEFHKTLNSYEGKPLTEQQKYEFAFLPLQAMDTSVSTLLTTGRDYLALLEKEHQSFEDELAAAIKEKVDGKKAQVDQLTAENAELSAKVEANSRKIQQLTEEMANSSSSIAVEKQAFEYALSNKISIINDRITKIQTYLNGTTK